MQCVPQDIFVVFFVCLLLLEMNSLDLGKTKLTVGPEIYTRDEKSISSTLRDSNTHLPIFFNDKSA